MKYLVGILMLLMFWTISASATMLPALPQATVDVTLPAVTGSTFTVNAGGNLQATLNAAAAANPTLTHQIVLQAGATFQAPTNGFIISSRAAGTGWIIIRSSQEASLPAQGVRVAPSDATHMPKILAAFDGIAGGPAITARTGSRHVRFIGLEITASMGVTTFGHVRLGTGGSPLPGDVPQTRTNMPTNFIFDRVYVHGATDVGGVRGLELHSKQTAVIDSYISGFYNTDTEAQAIESWNGAGPFLIRNNYLEAAGQGLMFGGAGQTILNQHLEDITVQFNHFNRPLSWKSDHPSWDGRRRILKALFELKHAVRVLFEGNVLEHSWALRDGMTEGGHAMRLTPRGSPNQSWATVEDVTIRLNLIRHVGGAILSIADSNTNPSRSQKRVLFQNNLAYDLGGQWDPQAIGASQRFWQDDGGGNAAYADMIWDHNTVDSIGTHFLRILRVCNTCQITNNLAQHGAYGIGSATTNTGNATLNAFFPGVVVQKTALWATANPSLYNQYPGFIFPATRNAVQFVNPGTGDNQDYHLQPTSPYKNAGTDGKDLGADIDALTRALAGVVSSTPPPSPSPEPTPTPTPPPPTEPSVILRIKKGIPYRVEEIP